MKRVLTPVRLPVAPHPDDAAALERKRAAVQVPPSAILHRDRVQRRLDEQTPALLRRQAS